MCILKVYQSNETYTLEIYLDYISEWKINNN
jgi:hypothetical protein